MEEEMKELVVDLLSALRDEEDGNILSRRVLSIVEELEDWLA